VIQDLSSKPAVRACNFGIQNQSYGGNNFGTVGVAQGVHVTFTNAGTDVGNPAPSFRNYYSSVFHRPWVALLDFWTVNYLLTMDHPLQALTTSYGFDATGLDPGAT
jgi:hypothetical protein